jgi:hypothetical protein
MSKLESKACSLLIGVGNIGRPPRATRGDCALKRILSDNLILYVQVFKRDGASA